VNSPWHSLPHAEALERLRSSVAGLTAAEATARLGQYGPNELPRAPGVSPFKRFLLQFHNVLIYVLLASATITLALGHPIDSAVIYGVVVINAMVGFIQEGKAEQALESIRKMLSPTAVVVRDGKRHEVAAETLVPGDVVALASGDRVPADLRLLQVHNLRIDEAALTGESVPAEKHNAAVAPEAVVGDRLGMAFSGTLVTFGQGLGVVVATGAATEVGRISRLLQTVTTLDTPLLRQMANFGRWLSLVIVALTLAVFAFGILVGDYGWDEMFLAAVGIAVAAIPEGLPAVLTITLAIGVQRMARRNAIVRRLPAVESLGSVTVICSDKTGTLTKNEMTVTHVVLADETWEVSGVGYAPHGLFLHEGAPRLPQDDDDLMELARAVLLCNDARVHEEEAGLWQVVGDPTEGALVTLARKAGLDRHLELERWPRTDVIPFESDHQYMATLHHDHEGHGFIVVKGAPERVLAMCVEESSDTRARPLDPARWHQRLETLAAEGLRLLAVAVKPAEAMQTQLTFDHCERGFTLLGLVGIIDPPRQEAIAAVAKCQAAGIRVKMITGDHLATASAIARQLGLLPPVGGRMLTGAEIEQMDRAALNAVVMETDLFARASPEHKLRLVEALQANGAIVAMTGDGVNDAPALKRADIGVAMGHKGTEAAKEAAVMVLADDNFATIAHAVEEGRTLYDNLRKAIAFILPTNGGEAGVLVVAILLGLTLPITAVQILWVNMVTAVTLALALAFEPPEAAVMQRPPRDPKAPLMDGFLIWRTAFVTTLLVVVTLGMFLHMGQTGASLAEARTAAVNTLVAGSIFYLLNSRFLLAPAWGLRGLIGNRVVWLVIGVLTLLQLLYTHLPIMQLLFGSANLDTPTWLLIIASGALVFVLVEVEKAFARWLLDKRQSPPGGASPSSL
jgi:magnesium-transporting ATPase (P-type)